MKFTEGYWEKNERANASYAMQAFTAEAIPGGMRIVSPFRQITDRGGALDVGTITTEFTSARKDIISVRSYHYEGYVKGEPRYELNEDPQETEVEITEDEAVMKAGRMTVRVDLKDFKITYEADGKVLTNIGFRNLGYMQYDRATLTKFPEPNYMAAQYQPYMVTELSLAPGECVYGLGERFTAFVKNGQVVDIWNEDGGTASQISYKNIPFYVTSKHYGVFVDHSDHVSFEVASEKVENVGFSVKGEEIRYHIIYGDDIKGVIENYTDLTGKPALPPAWSFGLWLSTSFTTNYDEETTNSFIQGMADREIPLHVFHFDCYWMDAYEWCNFEWDPATFPDPKGMLKRYHDRGLHICVWINPYIGQKSCLFKEGKEQGYLVKKTDGSVWQTDLWQPGMALVDFTNPDAKAWYQGKLKTLLDMGVDCFKTDFGERIPVKDIAYLDHSDPVKMHNYYTYLYNQAVFELLERERGTGEAVLFARSATVGGQQFPAHWGGDCSASYVSMAETLRGGLSLSLGGFGFWSHDISGFESTAPADIYKRWCQFGLLSSHSRLHGSSSYRVPWLFDEEACDILREFVNLKCRLMPYLYGQAVRSHKEGRPVLRPMFLDFPEDRACDTLDRQYMFGDSLLVAPIFKESGEVQYYLPEGTWYNLITGADVSGGKWQKETHDYHSLPLMIRPNTVLALGNNDQKPDYDYADGVSLLVSAFDEGAEAKTEIPDLKGETVMTVTAKRVGDEIHLHVEGGNGNYTVKSLSGCKVVVEA